MVIFLSACIEEILRRSRGSGGKNVFFQMARIPLLSVLICSTKCQYDVLKVSLKKMTRTYPLGVSNIEIFRAN
jgi:hypothetical protein